jgi:hypothetical protein
LKHPSSFGLELPVPVPAPSEHPPASPAVLAGHDELQEFKHSTNNIQIFLKYYMRHVTYPPPSKRRQSTGMSKSKVK